MREFIYYSKRAVTTGNFNTKDLMKAGRMDIVCNFVIMSFFTSHNLREDVKLHLIFDGPPNPPRHIEMFPGKNPGAVDISKKDIAGLIKRLLYKYKENQKNEVLPGYWIEKKSLIKLVEELKQSGKKIYLLDKRGGDVRKEKLKKNSVFIIGDHEGIPKEYLKRMKHEVDKISIGPMVYFASQSLTILQNELDRTEIEK